MVLGSIIGGALGFDLFWGNADYRCMKCGKLTTTEYNTLGLPSDMEIVDVHDGLAEKRYVGFWPDEYDIDHALKPRESPERASEEESNQVLGRLKEIFITLLAVIGMVILWPLLCVAVLIGAFLADLRSSSARDAGADTRSKSKDSDN